MFSALLNSVFKGLAKKIFVLNRKIFCEIPPLNKFVKGGVLDCMEWRLCNVRDGNCPCGDTDVFPCLFVRRYRCLSVQLMFVHCTKAVQSQFNSCWKQPLNVTNHDCIRLTVCHWVSWTKIHTVEKAALAPINDLDAKGLSSAVQLDVLLS